MVVRCVAVVVRCVAVVARCVAVVARYVVVVVRYVAVVVRYVVVVVTDGFTGNVVLKTCEGVASFVMKIIKDEIKSSILSTIAAMFLIPMFKRIKKKMDYSEYGGALFLGLNGISIKSPGIVTGKHRDRKSTRLNSSHITRSRMPSAA